MKPGSGKSKDGQLQERSVQNRRLLADYVEMAHDLRHESQTLEWSEALIGDAIRERRACVKPAQRNSSRASKASLRCQM